MRYVLVLAGQPPSLALLKEAAQDACLVGVDGGMLVLEQAGMKPDYAIGDWDSAPLARQWADVVLPMDKDMTDGEAAVDLAIQKGAEEILLLGASGGRADHYLGNLALLGRAASQGVRGMLWDETERIAACTAYLRGSLPLGNRVSVLPFGGEAVISEVGLKWPLDRFCLDVLSTRGISNVVMERVFEIQVHKGLALVMMAWEEGQQGGVREFSYF